MYKSRNLICAALIVMAALVVSTKVAQAQVCYTVVNITENTQVPITNNNTTLQRQLTEQWMMTDVWNNNMRPALMRMADQASASAMQSLFVLGTFLDAKHQMETQRVLQRFRARTHKDYEMSAGMCEFGTTVRSLAASERKSEVVAHVLSQRSQDRNLGNANTAADEGANTDKENRLTQYKDTYCNTADSNGNLDMLCDGGASDPMRANADIDFIRTVDFPWTLNVDFTNADLTDDEEAVFALASNLYGFDVFKRPPAAELQSSGAKTGGNEAFNETQKAYMDARAIVAKRSVAENSYNAITSMKAAGTRGSQEFLEAVLEELGASDSVDTHYGNEIEALLGDEYGPSYYAQMEILTKKIYQNPDFYTNLYDTPANVERKEVAMQAVNLMQKFDLFKSYLRTEANLSVLLELAVEDLQDDLTNQLSSQPN